MQKKLKILVLSESYPGLKASSMAYVHSRNQYYIDQGHYVEVLSFQAEKDYHFEGVSVFTEKHFKKSGKIEEFDLVVSHAPNLKNHIRFIANQYWKIKNIVFVIHGHEVLKKLNYYPLPFSRLEKNQYNVGEWTNHFYDLLKVKILGFLCNHFLRSNFRLVFVSRWMEEQFSKNLNVDVAETSSVSSIIPNSVNFVFEQKQFDPNFPKLADFITIRSFDNPKYAVDLIVDAAKQNPQFQFHLYGQGTYFKHYECPPNLKVIEHFFNQKDLPALLNQYRAALMPTRLDSQGVMMCEMATFGMPVVTSNLPICHEMLNGFENVEYVENQNFLFDAEGFFAKVNSISPEKNKKFFAENTVIKELELFQTLLELQNKLNVMHINDIAYVGSTLLREQLKLNPSYSLFEMPKPFADFPLVFKFFGLFERWKFARVIKRKANFESINLLHIHFVSSAIWFLNFKNTIVVHAHGSDVRVAKWNVVRKLINALILKRADLILYSTPDLKDYFGSHSKKTFFLPNPIDCEAFFPKFDYVPSKDILLYSSLSEIKGADIAVLALNEVKNRHPELNISVLGFGSMKNELKLDAFEVLERLPREHLLELLLNYRLILGQFKVGAIGVSDLEAMSAGKILITYFKFNEVYEEPMPIINVSSKDDIVIAVESFLTSPNMYEPLKEKSRDWVLKFHGVSEVVYRLQKLYDLAQKNRQKGKE